MMTAFVNLYSQEKGEISNFLTHFYQTSISLTDELKWTKEYANPLEMADIIGAFIENNDDYQLNMWISIDEGLLINVTDHNADQIIRYLYERFPY